MKRGGRVRMARALSCQPAFISQVLGGDLNFSMEQAEAASRFCGLSFLEKKYFFNLVHLEKASTSELKSFLKEENKKIINESAVLAERLNIDNGLSAESEMQYYSKWYFAAIHVLVTIEKYSSVEQIAERLKLEIATVREVLQFLERCGFVIRKNGNLKAGKTRIHLGYRSPLISTHHTNWRLQAIQAVSNNEIQNLHYSSVITISKKDAEKIREHLLIEIESLKKTIKDSEEEEIYSLNLDFFKL